MRLSNLIRDGRAARGWSQEDLASIVETTLYDYAQGVLAAKPLSPEEVEMGQRMSVSPQAIGALENFPARPLGSRKRRLILLGIVLALGLDRAEVNSLAGGL